MPLLFQEVFSGSKVVFGGVTFKKKLYGTDFLAHMDQICVTTSLATVFSPSFLDELSIHKRFFLVECSPQKKLKCQVTWDSPTKPLLFGGTVAGLRYGMPKLAFHILNLRKPSKKSEKKTRMNFLCGDSNFVFFSKLPKNLIKDQI